MKHVDNEVKSALTGRSLVVLSPEQTVREAATVLGSQEIGAAPVLDDGQLAGVFSERDIVQRVVAVGRDASMTRVDEVMTRDPQTIAPEKSLVQAFAIMIDGNFRHLPVVKQDGQVIAMLSMRDVSPEQRIMHRQWKEWTVEKQLAAANS